MEQGRAGFAAVVLRLDRLILDNQIYYYYFFFLEDKQGKILLCFTELNADKSLFIIAQTLDEHGERLNSPTSLRWTLPRAPARLPAPSCPLFRELSL